jgi:subtilase family serine protease
VVLSTLPDLVVVSVDSDNLDHGEVKVKIKNQGLRSAVRSDVGLVMTWGTKALSFTHSFIPLAAGQVDIVTFDVKMSLVQARFCATADATKKVSEDNETNNKLCGRFDGKP